MTSSKRIAIYARYSSDLQNPTSVEDQIRLCTKNIRQTYPNAYISQFRDAAISGTTMHRPGIVKLLHAVENGLIDIVYAEGLDRLSRNLKDVAAIYECLSYHEVSIFTLHEREVTQMHIAIKGLMNETAIKDMSDKVRRGQAAKIASGYSNPSCPYGYRVIRGIVDTNGRDVKGIREIDDTKAAVVKRIFEEFAMSGADRKTLKTIVKGLNNDGIPSPRGKNWLPTTLLGSAARRDGILRNTAYIGKPIYGKTRGRRNPMTGKITYPPTKEESWTKGYTPELRIIDDKLWQKVQLRLNERKERKEQAKIKRKPSARLTHNQQALTGWVKCGKCGSTKHLGNEKRYICSKHRYARQCTNARGTKEQKLLTKTLECIVDRIKTGPEFRDQIALSYEQDMKRNEYLKAKADKIKIRISRLLNLFEHTDTGETSDEISERLNSLQHELDEIKFNITVNPIPDIPTNEEIRSIFLEAVIHTFLSKDIETMRVTFGLLLEKIVLTPIPNKHQGETVTIRLREQGWPAFWRFVRQQKTSE